MIKTKLHNTQREVLSLEEYLKKAKKDKSLYASPSERMLKAIGEPELIDSSKEPRTSRIFGNRIVKRYHAFDDFYGMEEVIERLVSFFKHAAQGLEESRQVLYLLGPVGSAKSSLAERLKVLMEKEPIYVLTAEDGTLSPIFESPLGLLDSSDSSDLGIPERYLKILPSPWAVKRLQDYEGDVTRFKVTRLYPSQLKQIAISKTEPGDENNQDISALVGKLDIRKLESFEQSDPDAYSYSGGLCLSNQGLLEFVEMFKAPIKVLNPLLTATQEKNYKGTESIGAIPFDGIVIAHSNESEWLSFKNNKNNEAFLDRIYIIEVPYCVRVKEEVQIYKKLLRSSSLNDAPIAPGTLEMLAQFSVVSRIDRPENSNVFTKMRVYNGEDVREKDSKHKSLLEYRSSASKLEGFVGISTRFAYKILSEVFNYDPTEVAADPIHLLLVLQKAIAREHLSEEQETIYLSVINDFLSQEYLELLRKDISAACLDSSNEFGQNLFDRYVTYADFWLQDNDFRDPDTGQIMNRDSLDKVLKEIEVPAGIVNFKDFRSEVFQFALRHRVKTGKNPDWRSYGKIEQVIEKHIMESMDSLLPILSYSGQVKKEDAAKHNAFVERMKEKGYTEKQVRRLVEWYQRSLK